MARVLYGPPIEDAIARGDLAEMKSLLNEAEEFLRQHGDVRSSVELLKLEIGKRQSDRPAVQTGLSIPPYGVAIQQAIVRGDLNEMKILLKEAEAHLSDAGDVSAALTLLKS